MQESVLTAERVYRAKGDSLSADALIRDYLPFIRSEASKAVRRIVTERDDEMSIAMLAFHQAIEGYSRRRGAFLSYAALVIQRKLIDHYRTEKRHRGHLSLDEPVGDGQGSVADTLADDADEQDHTETRDATRAEIEELKAQLTDFGVSFTAIADNCPRQERTLVACQKALAHAKAHPELIEELKRTKRLPLARLAEGAGVERKTLERHRNYLLALLVIYSNGYEIIRGHLKQTILRSAQGEESARTEADKEAAV
jgi:RNA polymerase sigma factor